MDPDFDDVVFKNYAAQERYKKFSQKSVIPEREVEFPKEEREFPIFDSVR